MTPATDDCPRATTTVLLSSRRETNVGRPPVAHQCLTELALVQRETPIDWRRLEKYRHPRLSAVFQATVLDPGPNATASSPAPPRGDSSSTPHADCPTRYRPSIASAVVPVSRRIPRSHPGGSTSYPPDLRYCTWRGPTASPGRGRSPPGGRAFWHWDRRNRSDPRPGRQNRSDGFHHICPSCCDSDRRRARPSSGEEPWNPIPHSWRATDETSCMTGQSRGARSCKAETDKHVNAQKRIWRAQAETQERRRMRLHSVSGIDIESVSIKESPNATKMRDRPAPGRMQSGDGPTRRHEPAGCRDGKRSSIVEQRPRIRSDRQMARVGGWQREQQRAMENNNNNNNCILDARWGHRAARFGRAPRTPSGQGIALFRFPAITANCWIFLFRWVGRRI